jgi:hypothetical protein
MLSNKTPITKGSVALTIKALTIEEIKEQNDNTLKYIYRTPENFLQIFYNELLDIAVLPLCIVFIVYKIGLKTL